MAHPKVSIILPLYNAEAYLAPCLDSILSQSYPHFELLIVDDGSTDGTAALCADYAAQDPRIVFLQQQNAGVSAARNAGLERADGELVTFVDGDDWLDRQHLELLAAALSPGVDCAVCGYWLEYPDGGEKRALPQSAALAGQKALESLLSPRLFQGFLCNKLFRARVIRRAGLRLNPALACYEDLLFCAAYFSACAAIRCIPAATYHYRQHAESAVRRAPGSGADFSRRLAALDAWTQTLAFCTAPSTRRLCRARRALECAALARRLYCAGREQAQANILLKQARQSLWDVLLARVGLREKLRHLTTLCLPGIFSRFWVSRENRRF